MENCSEELQDGNNLLENSNIEISNFGKTLQVLQILAWTEKRFRNHPQYIWSWKGFSTSYLRWDEKVAVVYLNTSRHLGWKNQDKPPKSHFNLKFSIFSKSFQMFPEGMESVWGCSLDLKTHFTWYQTIFKAFFSPELSLFLV